MAIMAQGCYIAVIRIKIMNWSAICWYQLYLIVTHHRSDSTGHGVTSCRKYSLKNHAMARPSGNMKSQVSNQMRERFGFFYASVNGTHVVLSDGSRSIEKMALSEFIDRYSGPKTGTASCWESRLMNPNWMRGQSFPHAVRAPHFLEETLTKISVSIIAERTFLSFAAVGLWASVVGFDDDFRSAGASSLDIVQCFLLEPTDFWSTSRTYNGTLLNCCHSPLGGICGLCSAIVHRPTVGADGHPVIEADLYDAFVQVFPSGHSC